MAKNKFYVVWKGLNPGIYDNWAECKAQVDGQEGAKYKSFENREEAAKAFEAGYTHYLKTASSPKAVARLAPEAPIGNPINEPIFDLIERAEKWLNTHTYTTRILKWETSVWGEIPADFGRK